MESFLRSQHNAPGRLCLTQEECFTSTNMVKSTSRIMVATALATCTVDLLYPLYVKNALDPACLLWRCDSETGVGRCVDL
jgi:hypothetical protein